MDTRGEKQDHSIMFTYTLLKGVGDSNSESLMQTRISPATCFRSSINEEFPRECSVWRVCERFWNSVMLRH